MQPKLVSLFGLVVMIGVAWALSLNRKKFPWRTTLTGLALQFAFALFILKTAAGRATFDGAQAAFLKLLACAEEGSKLVFGPLANKG